MAVPAVSQSQQKTQRGSTKKNMNEEAANYYSEMLKMQRALIKEKIKNERLKGELLKKQLLKDDASFQDVPDTGAMKDTEEDISDSD